MDGIAEVEFVISVFVFITTVTFTSALIVGNIPLFHDSSVFETIKSKSYQYSELLLFDEGYPKDWNWGTVERIGLSSGKRYFVDESKMTELNTICNSPNGYNFTKSQLGLDYTREIKVEATYLDGSPVVGTSPIICEPNVGGFRQQFHTVRYGVLDVIGTPVIKLTVTVM